MRSILDTSVVIGGDMTAVTGQLAISAATLAELHFGVLIATTAAVRAQRLQRLAIIEREFEPLPVDDAVARAYGVLAAAVARRGRGPRGRVMDLLVAATAHAHGARLYTRNPKDLRGIEEYVDIVAVGA